MSVPSILEANRRHLLALAAVLGVLLVGHVFVEDRMVRYAGYLTIFSIWMAWFVLVVGERIGGDAHTRR